MLVWTLDWKRQTEIGKHLELLLLTFLRLVTCFVDNNTYDLVKRKANIIVPQVKDEAWWLVLGNTSTSQLYALKRVSFADFLQTKMDIPSNVNELKVSAASAFSVWLPCFLLCHENRQSFKSNTRVSISCIETSTCISSDCKFGQSIKYSCLGKNQNFEFTSCYTSNLTLYFRVSYDYH